MARPVTTPRDPATATPARFIIARWMFPTQRAHRPWEGDPIYEMSYDTRERIVSDIWSGEISDLTQVVEIDLAAGTAREISADIYAAVGEHSFIVGGAPHRELAKELDAWGVEYLTQDEIDREAARDDLWRRGTALSGAQLGVRR